MASIPLIVLLFILFAGCVYYLWTYRIELNQVFRILIKGKKTSSDLKDMSLEELQELLSAHKSHEHFERCAEIRDEIDRRMSYRL